ncbi:hypothetical protein T440DRAFT_423219, partial [Plenodomus tracheiphilus IPT5]
MSQSASPPPIITTVNYTLSWTHLDNPSDTTFTTSHFDLCNCPHFNEQQPQQQDHIYTRYTCSPPIITFPPPTDQQWVLQTPQIPFNILRPATQAEQTRRQQLDLGDTELQHALDPQPQPQPQTILLLTGPSPRGRYQSQATLLYLQTLPLHTLQTISSLTLLAQPYEEDVNPSSCTPAFTQLANYIVHSLSAFKTLYLCAWDEAMTLRREVCVFGVLLRKGGVSVVVE